MAKISTAEQFTFSVKRHELDNILCKLEEKKCKVRAILELRMKEDCLLVKLVPGKCENECQCRHELRQILKHLCVEYQRQCVLIVDFGKDVICDLRRVSCLLEEAKVCVNALYLDRCGKGVYQVSSVRQARCALRGQREHGDNRCSNKKECSDKKKCSDRKECDDKKCSDKKECEDKKCSDKKKKWDDWSDGKSREKHSDRRWERHERHERKSKKHDESKEKQNNGNCAGAQ